MRKLAKAIDFVIIRAIIFFIFFVWLVFYIKNTFICVLLSLTATIIVHLIISIFKSKIKQNKKLSKEDIKLKNNSLNQILLNEEEKNKDFFYSLILKMNATALLKDDNITFFHNEKNYICFLFFSTNGVSKDNILKAYSKAKKQKFCNMVIVTNKYDTKILDFVKTFRNVKIELVSFDSIFLLMKKHNTFIEITDTLEEEKVSFRRIFSFAFNRKRFFPYLLTSIILLLSSIFSPLKIYYLILFSISLIFACVSLFNKTFNKKEEKDIFEA